jgi:hypothetical protein
MIGRKEGSKQGSKEARKRRMRQCNVIGMDTQTIKRFSVMYSH